MVRRWQPGAERRDACRVVADTGFRINRRPSSGYIVGMCVCMIAYSSRTEKPICTFSLICLCLETRKRFQKGQNSESILSSSPCEGGFCSSETKHDRSTAPRPKLLVSNKRLQDKGRHHEYLPGSSPCEDGFCSSITKHVRGTEPRTKLFVSAGRIQKQRLRTRKLSWTRVPVKMGLGIIFPVISNDTYWMIRPILSFRAIKIDWNVNICRILLQ
jgi:hypothetical protein